MPKKSKKAADDDFYKPVFQYTYQHAKPAVIVADKGLFMWELVACFSEPATVCELERLCKDVAGALAESSTGTRLMQRYWNARWNALIKGDEEVPEDKRLLAPSALTRAEGKINWRKRFVEEYPLWLRRTFTGFNRRNNDVDEAKVLFERQELNAHLSGDQLKQLGLMSERKVDKVVPALAPASASKASGTDGGGGDGDDDDDGKRHSGKKRRQKGEGKRQVLAPQNGTAYTREDYVFDPLLGKRKGKTKKGGERSAARFAEDVEYD